MVIAHAPQLRSGKCIRSGMLKAFAAGMTDRTVTASEYTWPSPRGTNSTETLMVSLSWRSAAVARVRCGSTLDVQTDPLPPPDVPLHDHPCRAIFLFSIILRCVTGGGL